MLKNFSTSILPSFVYLSGTFIARKRFSIKYKVVIEINVLLPVSVGKVDCVQSVLKCKVSGFTFKNISLRFYFDIQYPLLFRINLIRRQKIF